MKTRIDCLMLTCVAVMACLPAPLAWGQANKVQDLGEVLAGPATNTDPADRMAVAAAAAKYFESNTETHWLLIWETAKLFKDRPESQQVTASLGEFFDTIAYRKRGTFMFRAIGTATELAKAQLDAPGTDTHVLVRGLFKTYSTSSNNGWYSAARDQLQKVVTPLAASSPKAVAEAATAMQVWMKEAPKEEKQAVFSYHDRLSEADVTKRLAELTGKKP